MLPAPPRLDIPSVDELPAFTRAVLLNSPTLITAPPDGPGSPPVLINRTSSTFVQPLNAATSPNTLLSTAMQLSPRRSPTSPARMSHHGVRNGSPMLNSLPNPNSLSNPTRPPLPEQLGHLMRSHYRATHRLFARYEAAGQRSIPLDAFADAVRELSAGEVSLSAAELHVVALTVCSVHEVEERVVDTGRLWRALKV